MSEAQNDDQTVAGYIRVSTNEQDPERQKRSIEQKYDPEQIEWYADIGRSGANAKRPEYQRLQQDIDAAEVDLVAAHELDRLGRSFSELAAFVEELNESNVDLDLVNQPVDTRGDDWMSELTLNLLIVFADAERRMIQDRVQQGVDNAIEDGKHVGRPPFGFEVEDGILMQVPGEYTRAQQFIREVRKGRAKSPTARFFEIPESAIESILDRSEKNYDVPFDNDEWQIERAKVKAGEKELEPLDE